MANPIWKDYYVDLGTSESAEFRILADGNVIYTGKAHKRPGQANVKVRINDICADHIIKTMPSAENPVVADILPQFVIQKMSGSWTTVDTVTFLNNWSYDRSQSRVLMIPVNGRISTNMPIILTDEDVLSQGTLRMEYDYEGNQSMLIPSKSLTTITGAVANHYISLPDILTDKEVMGLQWVRFGRVKFTVVSQCSRFALYYVNANGGWDMLLIEGNHSETDNLTRHMREVEHDNTNVSNRGRQNYVNEISKTLTLHTSWMSDEQSSRMHHLLNSTEVYLYDSAKSEMIPVVLTDTQTEYKTYKGNGGKLVNYAINVTLANDRIRR